MYFNPYFRMPFFPPAYRRYVPNPLFPQEKTLSTSNASKTHLQSNISKKTNDNCINYTNKYNSYSQSASQNTVGAINARLSTENLTIQEKNRATNDSPIFEFFGIKLYFDDFLILGLLFFLYSEGVQDQELFLTLILLLFS